MNTQKILAGLLAVQVALAAFTWAPRGDAGPVEAVKLVPGGGNTITHLTITAGAEGSKPVELTANQGAWTITSEGDFPAHAEKVAEVVDALGKIELRRPIATQATSYDKLKVADAAFSKKITFTADGKEHTLLVGPAQSKAVYLRVDGGAEVYQVKGFSDFVFKDAARNYWATNYVEFDKAQATSLGVHKGTELSLTFTKQGDAWAVTGGPEGAQGKKDKVEELLTKASALRMQEPAGKDVTPEMGLGDGAIRVEYATTSADGASTATGGFVIGAEKDGKHYVQAQGNPFVVLVPKYVVQPFLDATPDALTESAAPPAAPPTDAPLTPPI
jgi:hypothetical protein